MTLSRAKKKIRGLKSVIFELQCVGVQSVPIMLEKYAGHVGLDISERSCYKNTHHSFIDLVLGEAHSLPIFLLESNDLNYNWKPDWLILGTDSRLIPQIVSQLASLIISEPPRITNTLRTIINTLLPLVNDSFHRDIVWTILSSVFGSTVLKDELHIDAHDNFTVNRFAPIKLADLIALSTTDLNEALDAEAVKMGFKLSDQLSDLFHAQTFRKAQFQSVSAKQGEPGVFFEEMFFTSWNKAGKKQRLLLPGTSVNSI